MDKKFFSRGVLPIFGENALAIVAAVVSLLLQIISFFTTLDGAKAYFEATFALAPLFFALAVQTVVYFLENSIGKRVTVAKIAALMLAMSCSSYFSFVGIYNNINSPESYLERTYSSYSKQLTEAVEQLAQDSKSAAGADVDKAVNGIVREYSALLSEKSALDSLAQELSQSGAQSAYSMTAPKMSDYDDYEDYAAAYSAYISALTQGAAAEEQAQQSAMLAKYGLSDSSQLAQKIAQIESKIALAEGTLDADNSTFLSSVQSAREKIKSGDISLAEEIFALYNNLSGDTLEVPLFFGANTVELSLPTYSEVALDNPAAVVREKLSNIVSQACAEALAAGAELNADNFSFQNIYTLPIYAVFSGSFGADAVVSLILALLVDWLSLAFALISAHDKSVLSAGTTRTAFAMCSDIFERGIVTALQLGAGDSLSGEWNGSILAQRLGYFVERFGSIDCAEQGYALAAPKSDLSGYEQLVALLCQFSLAKQLSREEALAVSGGELDEPCVLLKTKFLLWVSEKFCSREKLSESMSIAEQTVNSEKYDEESGVA